MSLLKREDDEYMKISTCSNDQQEDEDNKCKC